MRRRDFLKGTAVATAALVTPRWLAAQTGADSTGAAADSARAGFGMGGAPRDSAAADSAAPLAGPTLTIAAGGDTTLGSNLEAHFDQQLAAGMTRGQLWPLYFAGVKPLLEAADIAIANLECPFTERGVKLKKNFNFRARRELVKILEEGGVDVVSLANNHTNDWGEDGVKDTLRTLDHARIAHFGAGMNLDRARRPAILQRRGIKVGFLGYYFQADPDMLEPEEVYAAVDRAGVAGCYKDRACMRDQIGEDVERLLPRVDAVIPFFHWGREGSYEVRDYQIELAHLCVDLGCKAVLGAHPHRLQGVEVYRSAPICYSLGNFVYGGIKEPTDTLTMVARLRVGAAGATAAVTPVQFTRWPEKPFQPFALEGEAREEAMRRIAAYSQGFEKTLPQIEPYRLAPVAVPTEP